MEEMKYVLPESVLKWWDSNKEVVYVVGIVVGYSAAWFIAGAWIF